MATRTLLHASCYDAQDAYGARMTADGGSDISFTTTPTHPVTGNTYVGTHGWKNSAITQNVGFGSGWVTINFWLRHNNATPSSDNDIVLIQDGASTTLMTLRHLSTGSNQFRLLDQAGSTLGTFTLSIDTWNHLVLKTKWEQSSTSLILMDEDTELINTTGVDTDAGGATGEIIFSVGCPVNSPSYYSTSIVIEEDDGASITTEDTYTGSANTYYIADYVTTQTTTSDFGSNPDAGSWANAMARPINDANTVQMDSTTPSLGGVSGHGPSGDTNIDTIFGSQCGWRYKRNSGINSPPQGMRAMMGQNVSQTTDGTSDLTGEPTPTTSFQMFWGTQTGAPSTGQWLQTQFGPTSSTNPRDILCSGCWMQVVSRNDAPAPSGLPGPILMMGVVPVP